MAMRFEHEFTVPVPVEQAWAVLLDVERVAPCLPGAALDSVDGESFTGRMKVRVGPITVTYRGEAVFQDVDKDAHSLTIKASGKEARGAGTASATVTARLRPEGADTRVTVETSFNVTGRPAQFGRGVMTEVGAKLIDKFAANLSGLLTESPAAGTDAPVVPLTPAEPASPAPAEARSPQDESPAPPEPTSPASLTVVPPPREVTPAQAAPPEEILAQDPHPAGTARTSLTPDEEALDLLEVAGVPLLKRAAPLAAALAGLFLIAWLIRRALRR
ncbi:carbon monoxide dehydrogenase subunit G [Planobispora rosea]|uniref:Carbon monoxide dehydrogenase subunit G n=1 Tax=Planobispora rosea TaxID=35762 RepID=A0A8J3WEA1_PLARO|nr:SRPBCC family protein [Planobispora rosea]GGS81549.1 carbon monoxide dehydrogenase subunit G [Planobispora rosea]GIH86135.1 carbon monoxide dehydrogenase subunit G [Planobispora rosea]